MTDPNHKNGDAIEAAINAAQDRIPVYRFETMIATGKPIGLILPQDMDPLDLACTFRALLDAFDKVVAEQNKGIAQIAIARGPLPPARG